MPLNDVYAADTVSSLHVFVHNGRSFNPISGATVTIIDGPNCQNRGTAVTDLKGSVTFANLNLGTYLVKADAINYTTDIASGVVSNSQSSIEMYLDSATTKKLTISTGVGGSVTIIKGFSQAFSISNGVTQTFSVASGSNVLLESSPYSSHSSCGQISNYHFSGWSGTINSQDSQLLVSMNSDVLEVANFETGYGLPPTTSTNGGSQGKNSETSDYSFYIQTNKPSYTDGDQIKISGQVTKIISSYPIMIRIQTPSGNLLSIQQITVSTDRTFLAEITASGNSWKEEGTYTIFAQYAPNFNPTKTTFEFKKPVALEAPQETGNPSTSSNTQPNSEPSLTNTQSQSANQITNEPQFTLNLSPDDLFHFVMISGIIVIIVVIAFVVRRTVVKRDKPKSYEELEKIKKHEREEIEKGKKREAERKHEKERKKENENQQKILDEKLREDEKVEEERRYQEFLTKDKERKEREEKQKKLQQEREEKERQKQQEKLAAERYRHSDDPYETLGIPRNATCEELKTRHKQLIKKYQSVNLVNTSQQEKERLTKIVAKINAARDKIRIEKGC